MRKVVVLSFCILLLSCNVRKTKLTPFVSVYKSDWVGNIFPEYIMLRARPQTFEIYTPGVSGSLFGEWKVNGDTLILIPKYECVVRNTEIIMKEIDKQDITILSSVKKYLIKSDNLINITDYIPIAPGFDLENSNEVYRLVK